jgi:hypothetical protein
MPDLSVKGRVRTSPRSENGSRVGRPVCWVKYLSSVRVALSMTVSAYPGSKTFCVTSISSPRCAYFCLLLSLTTGTSFSRRYSYQAATCQLPVLPSHRPLSQHFHSLVTDCRVESSNKSLACPPPVG